MRVLLRAGIIQEKANSECLALKLCSRILLYSSWESGLLGSWLAADHVNSYLCAIVSPSVKWDDGSDLHQGQLRVLNNGHKDFALLRRSL